MSTEGKIRTETHDHIFKIIIDNPAKKNAFSPAMMEQLSDALTELHNNDGYWVGVICAEGKDFTAGLDMPKFFGPNAEKRNFREGNVDVFGLQKRCKKPIVTAVQGIVFTIGIELMLAGDIVVAADDARFCQMESKRGIAPFGGAHFRFCRAPAGATRCIICSCAMNSPHRVPARSGWFRRWCRRASRSNARWRSPRSLRKMRRSAFRSPRKRP